MHVVSHCHRCLQPSHSPFKSKILNPLNSLLPFQRPHPSTVSLWPRLFQRPHILCWLVLYSSFYNWLIPLFQILPPSTSWCRMCQILFKADYIPLYLSAASCQSVCPCEGRPSDFLMADVTNAVSIASFPILLSLTFTTKLPGWQRCPFIFSKSSLGY